MDPTEITKQLLLQQKELKELSSTAKGSRSTVDLDQSCVGRLSRMDAMQMQAMAQEEERRRILKLQRIDVTLERLKAGDYGLCVLCDEPIAPKRLALDPTVTTCIQCARNQEQ